MLVALAQGLKGLADGREDGPHWPGLSDTADRLSAALEAAPRELPLPNGGREGLRHVVHQLHEAVLDASEARRRVLLASLAAALRWATPEAGTGTAAEAALHLAARDLARNIDALLADPIGEPDAELRSRLLALAARAEAFVAEMDFRFLYDAQAPAVRDRLPARRRRGAGAARRLTLRPARLRGAPRQLPRDREGRRAAGALVPPRPPAHQRGRRAGAALVERHVFEYLMPLLLMRRYPGTLLDRSCRLAVRRQVQYAASRKVPWGISESAFAIVDRSGHYQYKAFGVPGLGLKRGLGGRAGGGALCDRARRARRRQARRAEPAASRRARARGSARLLRGGRLHGAQGRLAARRHGRGRRHRGARLPRAPPGHDARRARARAARRAPWCGASTPTAACRRPSCCCRSACRTASWSRSRGRPRSRAWRRRRGR